MSRVIKNQTSKTNKSDSNDLKGLQGQIIGQQAEILAKLELLLASQGRLEQALQATILENNAVGGITGSLNTAANA